MDEKDNDLLATGKKTFERCNDHERDNRQIALEDIKFARLGEQWPTEVKKKRDLAQRPVLTLNKMPAFIRQVVNDARQNKPSIKVHPVDDRADPKTAEIINGLIRNIEYTSNADVAYDTAGEAAIVGGFGYWRIGLDYAYADAFDMDLTIERISNQFSVYGDPNSTAADSSDWDDAFVVDRMPKEKFKRKYKNAKNVDGDAVTVDWDSGQTYGDWINDDGVMIAEWWHREEVETTFYLLSNGHTYSEEQFEDPDVQLGIQAGTLTVVKTRKGTTHKVTQTFMTGADVLEVREWPGCYIPIVPVYGDEIIVEGKRHFRGLIHNAKDAQRMVNYWRSTSTELVALAPRVPFIGPSGAFDSDPNWNTANTENHSYLEYDGPTPPQRQPLDSGVAGGALQEALNAADDMKAIIGIYDASLGARSNETSGRAILARQKEGDTATFHFIDNISRAIRHTGRILIDLIPKVYSGERIIRVLGEDGTPANVKVNAQEPQPVTGVDGKPEVDETGAAIMALHDLTAGKYDLTVTTGPSYTTQREETAVQMTEFVRAFPAAAPIIGDLLAKSLDWPGADEIAERLKKINPALQDGANIPPQVQEQIQQGAERLKQLEEENQTLKVDQATEMKKIQDQYDLTIRKQDAEFALKVREMNMNKQFKLMEQDGVEVEGEDGQPVMKAKADIQNEAIMQGLNMLGQLIVSQGEMQTQALQQIAAVVSAPTQLVRDQNGRPVGAQKVMN